MGEYNVASVVVGWLLFGGLGVYLVIFWGSRLINFCAGFVSDGDQETWTLLRLKYPSDGTEADKDLAWFDRGVDYTLAAGLVCPALYGFLSVMVHLATAFVGWLVPILIIASLSVAGGVYILRGVVRLNKKLDKHVADKDVHRPTEGVM